MDLNATIIGQSIAMLVFVWFCMKFIWPPLVAALEERREKIADGLAAGERAQHDLEERQSKRLQKSLQRPGRVRWISWLRPTRDPMNMISEARDKAVAASEHVKTQAQAEIEQEIEQARTLLRKEVAGIAISGVRQLLGREVNEAANADLLQKLADEI